MGYATNLSSAKRAVEYVKDKIKVGASNKGADLLRTFGASLLCVAATRATDISISEKSEIPSDILKSAAKAEHVGCGNCGEQAALAFVYLAQELKVRKIDFMSRTNADHAFVVIGRKSNSNEFDYKTWGDECIVCDPWDGKYFPARDIPKEAYKGKDFIAESIFRLE